MKLTSILFSSLVLICPLLAQNRDSIFVQTYTDSVRVWNTDIPAACGTSYKTSISITGDSIAILEHDTSTSHQRCMCNYDVRVTLFGLTIGSYRIFIFRSDLYQLDTSFVGATNFTVGQSGSSSFSTNSYSSTCHAIVTVSNNGTIVPAKFSLLGNYPNPFNPITIIRYQIHQQNKVRLEIFDEAGKLITTLVNEEKSLGDYEVPWNASKCSSGLYFCKLTVGKDIQTQKMTLLK